MIWSLKCAVGTFSVMHDERLLEVVAFVEGGCGDKCPRECHLNQIGFGHPWVVLLIPCHMHKERFAQCMYLEVRSPECHINQMALVISDVPGGVPWYLVSDAWKAVAGAGGIVVSGCRYPEYHMNQIGFGIPEVWCWNLVTDAWRAEAETRHI